MHTVKTVGGCEFTAMVDGDAIKIKSAKVPKFRPGKGLKDALN